MAGLLGIKSKSVRNYDVFVTRLMEGSISVKDKNEIESMINLDQIKSMILQLIDGLGQLKKAIMILSHQIFFIRRILMIMVSSVLNHAWLHARI